MIDRQLIIDRLESFGKIDEISEVMSFIGRRKDKNVTVRILDQGPNCHNPQVRFACEVQQEDGKKAMGNSAATVDEAIAIVHWGDLD